MKILMLSIDRNIFKTDSPVRKRLIEYGDSVFDIHVICYTPKGFKEEKISPNVFVYPTNNSFRPWYFVTGFLISRKIIKEKEIELVTSQEAMTNILAIVLKLFFKFRLQVQIHVDFLSPYFKKESFLNLLRYFGYILGAKKADCLRVVSERIKSSLIEKLNIRESKIKVLPIWTDVSRLEKFSTDKVPEFSKTVLVASRLTKEKNVELAVRALAEVLETNIGLVIAGSGPEEKNLKKLVEGLGLEKRVSFKGWVDDLAPYYKTANIFLLTSRYEGYGLSLVEAVAARCAVVSTDVGVAKELGVKIVPPESKSIAQVISGEVKVVPLPHKFRVKKEEFLKEMIKSFSNCGK